MAKKRVFQYIFLLIVLTGILITGALQYTHDTKHHQCKDNTNRKQNAVDDCSLCWFVSHQVTQDFTLGKDLVPEAFVSIKEHIFAKATYIGYNTIVCLSKGNKDPPFLV